MLDLASGKEQWTYAYDAAGNETRLHYTPVTEATLRRALQASDAERGNFPVFKRNLRQWMMRITAYADRLLDDMAQLEGAWPEKVLLMQRNWIGRSEGLLIRFALDPATTPAGESELKIFTTRPDTLFGAKFMAISADHPLAQAAAAKNPDLAEFIADEETTCPASW